MSMLEVRMHATARHGEMYASQWPDPVVTGVSLPEFLLATGFCQADRTALIDAASGRVLSYRELADQVRQVAAGLAAHGLVPGQTFAIIAPNSQEWVVGCFGAMLAGGVVTGINPLSTAAEMAMQLADSGAHFVLTAAAFLPTVRKAAEKSGGRARIVVIGSAPDDTIGFEELFAHGCRRPLEQIDPGTLALLPYSSGTTGLAKGVMLTHRACMANVVQMRTSCPAARTDRILAVAPFFHAVGLVVLACRALFAGATLVTLPRFEVTGFLAALQHHSITQTVVVPPIVLALAQHPAVDHYDLSSLQWLGCGAAPLGAELQEACSQRIGCPVGQGYGMTEA
ncbi:MAG: AMP-binding protein, partial [Streptosporangiaceae bacterium]